MLQRAKTKASTWLDIPTGLRDKVAGQRISCEILPLRVQEKTNRGVGDVLSDKVTVFSK